MGGEEPKLRGGDGRGSPRAPSVVVWRPLWLRTLLVGGRGRTLGRRDGGAAVDGSDDSLNMSFTPLLVGRGTGVGLC